MNWEKLSQKKRVYVTALATIVGILLWAFITAGVITHDFNRKQVSAQGESQQATVQGIILTETKNDQKYWEVYGETGNYDSANNIAQLNNVIANFYKGNEVSMSLKSSKGTYNAKTHDILLYEDTLIAIDGGITLRADSLHWIDSNSPIVAKGNVKIQKDNQMLSTADKIIINPTYDHFKIEGNTVSKVYEDKK